MASTSALKFRFVSFRSPYLFYLLTVGVEGFHLLTLRHTPQSVGLLWTRDRPVAETSTWQDKHPQATNIHAPGGIRIQDPSKRSAADLCLRPRGHWDRPALKLQAILHFQQWLTNRKTVMKHLCGWRTMTHTWWDWETPQHLKFGSRQNHKDRVVKYHDCNYNGPVLICYKGKFHRHFIFERLLCQTSALIWLNTNWTWRLLFPLLLIIDSSRGSQWSHASYNAQC
jgi:hypothetical protein